MKIHIVKKGDTLWEIANAYGVDFEQVKQMNPQLSTPDMIMPGMKIKIPSTTKPVTNENMVQKETKKETQKPVTEPPFKKIPSKPLPVIKEDDHVKEKEVKPVMPVPEMPKMPKQPVPEVPKQPMMQMPTLEQDMYNYTTINIPQMQPQEEPEQVEGVQQMPPQQQMPMQPMPMPMPHQMPMMPMCCHVVPPCCSQMQHGQPPMVGGMSGGHMPYPKPMHPEKMAPSNAYGTMNEILGPSPNLEMPVKPMLTGGEKDCGCEKNAPTTKPMWDHMQPPYQQPMVKHMQAPYPPQSGLSHGFHGQPGFQQQGFHQQQAPFHNPMPTPPGYPTFSKGQLREEEEDTKSE